jgi:hypothetical protein
MPINSTPLCNKNERFRAKTYHRCFEAQLRQAGLAIASTTKLQTSGIRPFVHNRLFLILNVHIELPY